MKQLKAMLAGLALLTLVTACEPKPAEVLCPERTVQIERIFWECRKDERLIRDYGCFTLAKDLTRGLCESQPQRITCKDTF